MKLSVILLVLMFPVAVFTQEPVAKNETELKLQRERALALSIIEETATEAPLWDDRKAAVSVLAEAADISWSRAPGQSQKRLVKAWDMIDSVTEDAPDPNLKVFLTRSHRTELRSLVLRIAQAHDPKLAEAFIKSLETKEPADEKKERGAFDDRSARSEQFLRLALQAVETNPDLAFALAQRSLADGVSFSLQNVLTSLRRKNVELADRLFDAALARFASGFPDPSEAEVLSGYLFQPGLTFSTNNAGVVIMSMNPALRTEPVVARAEPQRARAFLVAAYQAFLARPLVIETPEAKTRSQKIWAFGMRHLDRYATYATEFVTPARDFLAQLQTQLFPEGRADPFSNNRQTRPGDDRPLSAKEIYETRLADLEESADRETNPAAKRLAYVNVVLAVDAKDYERARSIAEKIDNDDLRADVISYAIYRAALSYLTEKDTDKAQQLADLIGNSQRRALVKIAIAQRLLANKKSGQSENGEISGEEQRAFDLLDDVAREMKKESPSKNAAKILLGRAALLSKLDRALTLISLEDALSLINKLDSFELREATPPALGLSVAPRSQNLADLPRLMFSFRSAVEPLIKTAFEGLTELAARFTRKEVRGTARFEVAKLYLQSGK